jgi:uncharacterized SAM-binding protein YcdF (DUF218 family)
MRLRRFLFRSLIVILIASFVSFAIIDAYGMVDHAQSADVIVVLGSQVLRGGRPGRSLARRADHAFALYQQGYAEHIICTGGFTEPLPVSEARVACDRIVDEGAPLDAVIYEERATSTEENAAFSAALMREHDWDSAIIVSDGYHLLRATWMFQRAGVETYPSPAQVSAGPMNVIERYFRSMREVAALGWYGIRVALNVDLTSER